MSKKEHSLIRRFITQCLIWGLGSATVLAGFWMLTPRPEDPLEKELEKAAITHFEVEDFKPKAPPTKQTPWGTPQTAEPQRIYNQNGNTIGFGRLTNAPLWVACTNFVESAEATIEDQRGTLINPDYKLEKLAPSVLTSRGLIPMSAPLKEALKTWRETILKKGFTHIFTGPIYSDKIIIIQNYPVPDAIYGLAAKENGTKEPTIESVIIYPNNKGPKITPLPYPELVKITGVIFFFGP